MFLRAKFIRSNLSVSELANIVGAHKYTVAKWVTGRRDPQRRFLPVLKKLGLWGTEVATEVSTVTEVDRVRAGIKERIDNLRALEAARISEAVDSIRREFKQRYEFLQNECRHSITIWSAKMTDQGLVYVNCCSECSKEIVESAT